VFQANNPLPWTGWAKKPVRIRYNGMLRSLLPSRIRPVRTALSACAVPASPQNPGTHSLPGRSHA
ncbi:MAG: hypothetical protein RXS25_18725, partial [Paraburkholderia sp.]|uniref:hypothetical protein n=1 Tax=Paraburkholderia sp. TaxID=1926495 RepID=UPI00397C67AB